MTGQKQDFFHHYRAMDTRVLLARYRSEGLLPEAKVALLDVLADRGYVVEALEGKGANAFPVLSVEDGVEAHSASVEARQSLSAARQSFKRRATAFALQARERAGLRETWVQIVRIALLVVCWWSMLSASLFGVGLFVVANVFCDHEPLAKCFHEGLNFFEVGAAACALLVPAIVALLFTKKWIAWYLKAVPMIALAVFVAAIHWYQILPMFCAKAALLSALIAVLSTVYLILSRTFIVHR